MNWDYYPLAWTLDTMKDGDLTPRLSLLLVTELLPAIIDFMANVITAQVESAMLDVGGCLDAPV